MGSASQTIRRAVTTLRSALTPAGSSLASGGPAVARRRRRHIPSDDGARHLALARIVARAAGAVSADEAEQMGERELRGLLDRRLDHRADRHMRTALDEYGRLHG